MCFEATLKIASAVSANSWPHNRGRERLLTRKQGSAMEESKQEKEEMLCSASATSDYL